jgi:D-glycero-D-manno-heptose 1,7-bisphosphate phosphatase
MLRSGILSIGDLEPFLMKPAVFLDRDGTIIQNVHHLSDPGLVELIPGAADGIKLLRKSGFLCVVVSNQSAVGRGLLTLETLDLIHSEMCRQLADQGAEIDGWYFCPTAPKSADRTTIDDLDRKPGPGMLLRASRDLGLDVEQSWMIGDMISDVLAGRNAGCSGNILLRTGLGLEQGETVGIADHIADNLLEAANWVVGKARHRVH